MHPVFSCESVWWQSKWSCTPFSTSEKGDAGPKSRGAEAAAGKRLQRTEIKRETDPEVRRPKGPGPK